MPINITSELKETFDSVNKALNDAFELALKQPIPGKQHVLKRDASFRSAGYTLMIEDNPDQKKNSQRGKRTPPWHFAQNFSPSCNSKVHMFKRIFANLYDISWFSTHSVGSNKANHCPDKQQFRHPLLPNKGNPTSTVECM